MGRRRFRWFLGWFGKFKFELVWMGSKYKGLVISLGCKFIVFGVVFDRVLIIL